MEMLTESVSEVMSQPAVVIGPDWSVAAVFELAARKRVHHFPILECGSLVGIVCTCDLRNAEPAQHVGQYARHDVATIGPERSAVDAARLMAERAVGSAVVIGPEGVYGIVTREDLQNTAQTRSLLAEGHCAACGSYKHLRSGPDGAYLCAGCADRARGENWFDTGVGD
jgi:predicted transcriptional regulator